MHQGIEDEVANPFEEVIYQSILGTQNFVDWVKNTLPRKQEREVPSLGKLQHDIPVNRIIEEVACAGQVQPQNLLERKTGFKELRQIAMELSYRYSNQKQAEIGTMFGVDYSTVSQNRARLKAKLKSNDKINKRFKQIKEQVINMSIPKI